MQCALMEATMDHEFRSIIAIVRTERLQAVEEALKRLHLSGVSLSRVKGYGEYVDFFARDWMSSHARIEIFTSADRAPAIVEAILDVATTGTNGDGLVCVVPVESVWRVRTRSGATATDL
jgi:nitrogen regulatory protein P-II 1